MVAVEVRREWCEENITSKEGRPFDLTGRDWVIPEFWIPADGWRLWPVDKTRLCEDCKRKAGSMVPEWDWKLFDQLKAHARKKKDCSGLELKPIIVIILNLPRREGKTFNVASWILSTIFLCLRRFVLFVATAGDQTKNLFEDNFVALIENSEELQEYCEISTNEIKVSSTKSRLRIAKTTSFRTITGGGESHIVLEEARDQHARVVAAAAFSIRDQNGYECPYGHVMQPGIGGRIEKRRCPTCNELLIPWYPRIIIPSSSGVIDENEDFQWFGELVEHVKEFAPWGYHLYATEQSTNPAVSKDVTEVLEQGFGAVPSLRSYVEVELTNRARRKGEDWLTKQEIEATCFKDLMNVPGDDRPCVAYLDTSETGDLTSLVICADKMAEIERPWHTLQSVHLMKWRPSEQPKKRIDGDIIRAHLELWIPRFPDLRALLVDDRGRGWAKDLVVDANANTDGFAKGWGHKLYLFHGKGDRRRKRSDRGQRIPGIYGGDEDRSLAYTLYDYRIAKKLIEHHDDDDLKKELRQARKKDNGDGTVTIMDANRKIRHLDVAEAYAGCSLLAYLEGTNRRQRLDELHGPRRIETIGDKILAKFNPLAGYDPERSM
jgi:hypothetical protein